MATIDYKQKIKDYMNSSEVDTLYKSMLNNLFPELKESEDERIRKQIKAFIKSRGSQITQSKTDAWLALLEKQGEQELLVTNVEKNIHPIIVKKTGLGRCAVEHEEKPADKVEPKFKKGEWLVENHPNIYARFLQILEIYNFNGKNNYVVSRDLHNDKDVAECEFIETHWHPFYVKDAKDGDVLYSLDSNQPFIYKERKQNEQATAYCGLNIYGKFFVWGTKDCVITLSNYVPATKEQRDLLFQKMHEAGYEWDAEKKELKKIEQNPTQEVKPFEAEHGKYYYCIKDYFCGGRKQASKGDVVQALRGLPIMGLKDASEYFLPVNFIKCYSTWSEEDEYIIEEIEAIIDAYVLEENNPKALIDWLKSLRPQNTWRPSDEQMKALNYVVNLMASSESPKENDYYYNVFKDLKEQLKQL